LAEPIVPTLIRTSPHWSTAGEFPTAVHRSYWSDSRPAAWGSHAL